MNDKLPKGTNLSVIVTLFRRNETFDAGQQLFFRHLVEGDGFRSIFVFRVSSNRNAACSDEGCRIGLGKFKFFLTQDQSSRELRGVY